MIGLESKRLVLILIALIAIPLAGLYGQVNEQHKSKAYAKIETWLISQEINIAVHDLEVVDLHTTEHNGVTHVSFVQLYRGVPIHGSLSNIAYSEERIYGRTDALIQDIADRVLHDAQQYSPSQAMTQLASHLDYPFAHSEGRVLKKANGITVITDLPYARNTVNVTAVWAPDEVGSYHQSWRVDIDAAVSSDHYDAVVSGLNGKVLSLANQTVSCKFHHDGHGHNDNNPIEKSRSDEKSLIQPMVMDQSQYRVFAPPVESPIHGDRSLVVDPSDPIASPNGWHDVDNVVGPEYTITRGNNAHAYQDPEDDDNSNGDEPEGGVDLIFDFPFISDATPDTNLDADVTNLFFWNNYVHDWSYRFGFNEAAGNFQEENFGRGGRAGDHVNAQALDGGDIGNANFSAPRDGDFGRMQMYRWIVGNDLTILSPAEIQGDYNTGGASFGPSSGADLTGIAAVATDGVEVNGDACETINNANDISGKIALIERGICDFSFKVFNAQNSGAIAAIVCNNLDNAPLVTMNGGANADDVTIPSLFLSKEDCQLIKDEISQDVELRFNKSFERSSSFDNGIVAHEYGHGISLRLVGGASNSGCLNNDEQVGEGWSDFFALVLTQKETDTGDIPRGIGNYVIGQNTDGPGIRRYRYSTDMSINPQTHSHVRASTRPHAFGEIWASALWDMYWNFIEEFGYDPTWQDRNSGNFKAIQIVIDGMKLQGCNAGVLDARNAILEADQLNYFGENELLIWKSFARRGLGFDAIGGDGDSRYDNADGFLLPPSLTNEVFFNKIMTPTIDAGEIINVEITLENNSQDLEQVVITDEIPEGLEVVTSRSEEFTIDGNILSFDLETVDKGRSITKTYQLSTATVQAPAFQLFDNFEGPLGFTREESNDAIASWNVTTVRSAGGIFSLRMVGDTLSGETYAITKEEIVIADDNKLLKFQQRFETELGIDGGVVEISIDGGTTWEFVPSSQFLVRPYNDIVTFDNRYTVTTPAFTGIDTSWDASVIDLSMYAGQSIFVRFRYVLERFVQSDITEGWAIDNFEIYDRKEFSGKAQLISGGAMIDNDTAVVYINSDARITPTKEVTVAELSFQLSPNPAQQEITLSYLSDRRSDAGITISSSNGQILFSGDYKVVAGQNEIKIDIASLPAGIYTLQLKGDDFRKSENFVKIK